MPTDPCRPRRAALALCCLVLDAGLLAQPDAAAAGPLRPAADPAGAWADHRTEQPAFEEVRGLRRLRVPRSRGGVGSLRPRAPRHSLTVFRFRQRPGLFPGLGR